MREDARRGTMSRRDVLRAVGVVGEAGTSETSGGAPRSRCFAESPGSPVEITGVEKPPAAGPS